MSKFVLLLLFVAGGAFAKDQGTLDCNFGAGRSLCYNMDSTISSYQWTCRGASCREVWRNQLYAVEDLAQEILSLPRTEWVNQNVGHKAYQLAHTICNTSRRFYKGDYNIIVPLVNEENGLLNLLRDLQHQAGLHQIIYCQVRVN